MNQSSASNLYVTEAWSFPVTSQYFVQGPRHRRTNKRSLTNFNPDRLTLFATLCQITSSNLSTVVRKKFEELVENACPPDPQGYEETEQLFAAGVPVEGASADAASSTPGESSSSWNPEQDPWRPAAWFPPPLEKTTKKKKKKKKRAAQVED